MGWCSATIIFDEIADIVAKDIKVHTAIDKEQVLYIIAQVFREHDWDCECDSKFYEHPAFKGIFNAPLV